MGQEYRAKIFKSGNSMALRLPKALGLTDGAEMRIREDRGSFIFVPADRENDRIDLTGIYGSVPGIRRPPCDENPRDWDPDARQP